MIFMSDLGQPHDRLLKTLLSQPETAGTLLRERLPKEIGESLSPDPPELVEGSFVDEGLRAHLTDRLFRVRTIHGRTALLYVLIEHKSTPEPRIAWQLIKYLVEALKQWEREQPEWDRLPAIVPFVFYHGVAEWRIPEEFLALVDAEEGWSPFLLNFRYTVTDLGRIEDDRLSRQPRLRAWLLAAKYALREHQQQAAKPLLIQALVAIPDEDFRFLMRYVIETFRTYDEPTVREIVQQARPREETTMMSIFAEELMAKGELRGLNQGRQEGLREGEARTLLRQMHRRFGAVPEWVEAKIASADLATLEQWTERILDARSLEELFQ